MRKTGLGWKKIIVEIVMLCVLCVFAGCARENNTEAVFSAEEAPKGEVPQVQERQSIFVYVCGAVNAPGVYELAEGDRIFRAIEAAGGYLPEADEQSLNAAELLTDGQMIRVPLKGEEEAVSESDDRISLNRGTKEELVSLPGIGEARAEAVISYRREHGGFHDLEELKNIDGIGEATFEKLKDRIRL